MAIIIIEPSEVDVSKDVQRALGILLSAGIKARRRSKSLQPKGLIEVSEPDAQQAIELLLGSDVRALLRPA